MTLQSNWLAIASGQNITAGKAAQMITLLLPKATIIKANAELPDCVLNSITGAAQKAGIQPSVVTTLMSLFPLLKHHLFASPPHHHIMSQSTEDREEAIQNALEDIREGIYPNVERTAVAFGIPVRLLQKHVWRSGSRFDRPVINKAPNEV